jgi:branched-chain amino acid transport system substrate-binding protein
MRRHRARLLQLTAASAVTALAVAACSSGSASSTSSTGSNPIVVGFTEPLSGSFSADGRASLRGYQLWASDVNSHGGLLGRPVQLKYLNDNSNPTQVTKEYTELIQQDHVDLTLAPFSSLLTTPAGYATQKFGYALPEGSGTAPSVYGMNNGHGDPDLFGVSTPVVDQMVPFANWVVSLPPSVRPKTAAYPMVSDPFADPPVYRAQAILQKAGVKTVYPPHPITQSNLAPFADAVAARNPQIVVLGSVDVPTVLTFIHEFELKKFNPQMFIAASGPDQGAEFLNHVDSANAEAIMVPDGWYGGEPNALSHVMVQDYIARYGGTTSGINADVAEAYSAGEVLAAAVTGTQSTDNKKIITYLHSGVTLQTVQGPAKFDSNGRNTLSGGHEFIFQWQGGQFLQVLGGNGVGSATIEPTKPHWQTGG